MSDTAMETAREIAKPTFMAAWGEESNWPMSVIDLFDEIVQCIADAITAALTRQRMGDDQVYTLASLADQRVLAAEEAGYRQGFLFAACIEPADILVKKELGQVGALARVVKEAVEDETERCAKLAEKFNDDWDCGESCGFSALAAAIRTPQGASPQGEENRDSR